jgi:pimeloyl-ACP methyl ester carboxylesterase
MRTFDRFDGAGMFDKLPIERRSSVLQNTRFFKAMVVSSDPFPNLPKNQVRRLRVPTLVIRGANTDELHRRVTEEVARVVTNAQLVIIPQVAHGSARQNAPAFNTAVLEFLNRQDK